MLPRRRTLVKPAGGRHPYKTCHAQTSSRPRRPPFPLYTPSFLSPHPIPLVMRLTRFCKYSSLYYIQTVAVVAELIDFYHNFLHHPKRVIVSRNDTCLITTWISVLFSTLPFIWMTNFDHSAFDCWIFRIKIYWTHIRKPFGCFTSTRLGIYGANEPIITTHINDMWCANFKFEWIWKMFWCRCVLTVCWWWKGLNKYANVCVCMGFSGMIPLFVQHNIYLSVCVNFCCICVMRTVILRLPLFGQYSG